MVAQRLGGVRMHTGARRRGLWRDGGDCPGRSREALGDSPTRFDLILAGGEYRAWCDGARMVEGASNEGGILVTGRACSGTMGCDSTLWGPTRPEGPDEVEVAAGSEVGVDRVSVVVAPPDVKVFYGC